MKSTITDEDLISIIKSVKKVAHEKATKTVKNSTELVYKKISIEGCFVDDLKKIECVLLNDGYENIEIEGYDDNSYLIGSKLRELTYKEQTALYEKRYDVWWNKTLSDMMKELDIDRKVNAFTALDDIKPKCKSKYSMEMLLYIVKHSYHI